MPSRGTGVRTVEVVPEGLEEEVRFLQNRIDVLKRELSQLLTLEPLDATISRRQKELEEAGETLAATRFQLAEEEAKFRSRLDADRVRFEETCRNERRAIQEESEKAVGSIQARREDLEEEEHEAERRRLELHDEEAKASEETARIDRWRSELTIEDQRLQKVRADFRSWQEELKVEDSRLRVQEEKNKKDLSLIASKEAVLTAFDAELGKRKDELVELEKRHGERSQKLRLQQQELLAANQHNLEQSAALHDAQQRHHQARAALEAKEKALAQTQIRLSEANERMAAREARCLELEARNREDEMRIERAREQIRLGFKKR